MSTLVSVVVPTYRRPDLLERCLAALVAQRFPKESFEIVVADDGPDESVRRVVRNWALLTRGAPEIRYVPVTGSQGPAGARNRGWEAADSPVIAFTDDDTVPRPDWLVEGYQVILSSPMYVAAGGRIDVPANNRARTEYEKELSRLGSSELLTANCFVRRSALEAIGGFDERFTSAWRDDCDLQFTLMKIPGEIVKAPRAVVEHPMRTMTWMEHLRAHRKVLFDALLFKKHPDMYRQRIRRHAPWSYYVMVASLAVALLGTIAQWPWVTAAGFAVWLVFTTRFTLKRLEGSPRTRGDVLDVILGSIMIPPVAIFWRLAGALRFRVLFL